MLHYFLTRSLEVYPLGDLRDVLVGEGALGIEVVATLALHASHQAAHVRRETVFGRSPR